MKYFSFIFWSLLIAAGVLMVITTDRLENRLSGMEKQIDEINIMLKEIGDES
tara:strand:- start:475 stop:630 length:156 start_codon:yes stop_codon:yes gene_type:complete